MEIMKFADKSQQRFHDVIVGHQLANTPYGAKLKLDGVAVALSSAASSLRLGSPSNHERSMWSRSGREQEEFIRKQGNLILELCEKFKVAFESAMNTAEYLDK
jgi:hypothetical protein